MKRTIIIIIISGVLTLLFYLYLNTGINYHANIKTSENGSSVPKEEENNKTNIYKLSGKAKATTTITSVDLTEISAILSNESESFIKTKMLNPSGNFYFDSIPQDEYQLKIKREGYSSDDKTINISSEKEVNETLVFNLNQLTEFETKETVNSSTNDTISHNIKKGESLAKIAKIYSTTVKSIQKLNQIDNPDKIMPDQQIKLIPGKRYKQGKYNKTAKNHNKTKKGNKNLNFILQIEIIPIENDKNTSPKVDASIKTNGKENNVISSETRHKLKVFFKSLKVDLLSKNFLQLGLLLLLASSLIFGWHSHILLLKINKKPKEKRPQRQPIQIPKPPGKSETEPDSPPQIPEPEEVEEVEEEKKRIILENKLTLEDIKHIKPTQKNEWLTVGASVIGKSHTEANPPIPCQDNHNYYNLKNGWQVAIVCDGAGSAKLSQKGSELIARKIMPAVLKKDLPMKKWYKKGAFPQKSEWKEFAVETFRQTISAMQITVDKYNEEKNKTEQIKIEDLASTVILVLYRSNGALVANIGDGRSGYLNNKGEFHSFFKPFKGEEANQTVFITSNIWNNTEKYISANVVQDNIWAVTAMSDGFENASYICSNIIDGQWFDLNLPSKKLFLPLIKQLKAAGLKSIPVEELKKKWKELLTNGNKTIENEPDDRTMILSIKL